MHTGPGIKKSSNKLKRLFDKKKGRSSDHPFVIKFKSYRNLFNKIKKRAKQEHYKTVFTNYHKDIKNTWRQINLLLGKSKNKNNCSPYFKIGDRVIYDKKEIGNEFCKYLSSVGSDLADKITPPGTDYKSYLNGNYTNSFYLCPTDADEVEKVVFNIKTKHSSGDDDISSFIVKHIQQFICSPLATIFNKSFEEGVFPDDFKISRVVPIYKSKEAHNFNNYRPISLLPVFSKILEKLVHKRLYSYLSKQNILYDGQYGFRKSMSTVDALTEFYGKVVETIDKGDNMLAVFLDLSKAFDTLPWDKLLFKLNHYGIRGVSQAWFHSYLSNRNMYVLFNGFKSDTLPVTCGVPQGSVLGPLLFILYVNDLHRAVLNSATIQFADDSTLFKSGKCNKLLFSQVNEELQQLCIWFKANTLSLNALKSHYVLFRGKRKKFDDEYTLSIDNVIIQRCKCVSFFRHEIR